MASAFNLTAQINLRGPTNLKPIVAEIKRELGSFTSNVNIKLDNRSAKSIDSVSNRLKAMNDILIKSNAHAKELSNTFSALSASLGNIQRSSSSAGAGVGKVSSNMQQTAKNIKIARTEIEEFGRQSALAVRRFAAFSVVTSAVFGLTNAITSGFKAFIDFDRELVKLQQVTGKGAIGIKSLEQEITRLATTLGVSSESLMSVASTLAQAGLTADETRTALAALAKTELAPSFDNLTDTTEGAIAAMRQFGLQAQDLEAALGSINAVAAAFAVESKDIITAIQRTGGVFAAASKGVTEGKDALNEFVAVFTSVRATTRESAETIATGLRTIFTRIQRADTIQQLKQFGVNLQDLEGKFVGPYEAVKRLSEALNKLDPRDVRFATIVEELGGFRQIGKVIPLIQQFATAQQALGVAQKGQGSLTDAQVKAQQSLANQIAKVREQFLALIRDIGQSTVFQGLFKIVLGLTSGFLSLASAFKPILPILAVFTAIKGASAIGQFATGFFGGLKKGGGAGGAGQNIGENLSGAKEKQRSEATAKAADAIRLNTDALQKLTSAVQTLTSKIGSSGKALNAGGKVMGFARGGVVPGSGNRDTVPAMLMPGEFVIRKKAVEKLGAGNLQEMNKYAAGGPVKATKLKSRAIQNRIKSANSKIDEKEFKSGKYITDSDTFTFEKREFGLQSPKNIGFKKFEENVGKKIGGTPVGGNAPVDIPDNNFGFPIEVRNRNQTTKDNVLLDKLLRYNLDQSGGNKLIENQKTQDRNKFVGTIGIAYNTSKVNRSRFEQLNKGGKLGARSKFKELSPEEIGKLSTKDLIQYGKDLAYDIFSTGGAGMATGHEFIEVPKERIIPELDQYLTSYLGKRGFWQEKVAPFGKPTKASTKTTAKQDRAIALQNQVNKQADEVAAREQQWTSIRDGSEIDNYLLSTLTDPILSDYKSVRKGGKLDKAFHSTRLRQAVNKALESYDNFDYSAANIDKLVSGMAAERFAAGGFVQNFMAGGTTSTAGSISQEILDRIKALGGPGSVKDLAAKEVLEAVKASGAGSSGKLLDSRSLKANPNSAQFAPYLEKVLDAAESAKKGKESAARKQLENNMRAATGAAYQFGLVSLFGPNGELGYSSTSDAKELTGKNGEKFLTQIVRKSLPERYAEAIKATQADIAGVASRGAERFQYSDIFGVEGPLAFDFDDTLVKGADIYAPNGGIDIKAYNDLEKVKEALADAQLTLLGKELSKRVADYPQLLDSIRILTARPQSNAPLLADKLSQLGLPISSSKITGVSGGLNKVNNLSDLETLIDDNLENIQSVLGGGKKGYLYNEPRDIDTNDASSRKSMANMEGYALEEIVKSLGVRISADDDSPNRPIDYPQGLGVAASKWNIKSTIPTDTKRTNDSSALSRIWGEAQRYFVEKFAFGGKADGEPSEFEKTKQQILDKYPDINFRISKRKRGFGYNILGGLKKEGDNTGNYADFQQASNLKQLSELADKIAYSLQYQYGPDIDSSLLKKTQKFAGGGTVSAMVSSGEAYVSPKLAKKIGYAKLDKMNQADRNGMKGFAGGGGIGLFSGPGSGTSDSIGPISLPVGSYVIREKASKALGLYKNGGTIKRFAEGGRPSKAERKRMKEAYLAEQRGGITREEARAVGMPRPDYGAGASRKRDVMARPQGEMNIAKIEAEVIANYRALYKEEKKKIDELYAERENAILEQAAAGTISTGEAFDQTVELSREKDRAKAAAKDKLTTESQAATKKATEEYTQGKQTTQIGERKAAATEAFDTEMKSAMANVAKEVKAKYQQLYDEERKSLKDFYDERYKQVQAEGGDVGAVLAEYKGAVADAKQAMEAGLKTETAERQAALPEQIAAQKKAQVEEVRSAKDPFYEAKKAAEATASGSDSPFNFTSSPAANQSYADQEFLKYKAQQSGTSEAAVKLDLAQKLGKKTYENQAFFGGKVAEAKTSLVTRRESAVKIGGSIQAAKDAMTNAKDDDAKRAAAQQLADAQSRLTTETEGILQEMIQLRPDLAATSEGMEQLSAGAKQVAQDLSTGDLAAAQKSMESAVAGKGKGGKLTEAEASSIARLQVSKETGVDAGLLQRQLGTGKGARMVENQKFIQSREGQRFGSLSQFAPGLTESLSKTKLGRGLGAGADFISGKGGALSQAFAGAGGFQGIGAGIAVGAEGLKQFLPKSMTSDPNTAGALGALGGAGSGAAVGAQLGSFAGPIGTLIGGVGGAIIGGIQGFFSAKNQAILTNALENIAKTTGDLDTAFKKLEQDSSEVNFKNAQKAFGAVLDAGTDIEEMAFAKTGFQNLGSTFTGGVDKLSSGFKEGDISKIVLGGLQSAFGASGGGLLVDYFSAPSQAQKQEAIGAMVSGAGNRQESATRLAEVQLKKSSSEDLGKILDDIKNGTGQLNPIVQQYAAGMAASSGKTIEQVSAQAKERAAIDAYMKKRKESGATDEQIAKELEKNQAAAIKEGEAKLKADAELLVKQQMLAKAAKELTIATENLMDVYRRANAYAEKYSSDLEQFAADTDALLAGLGGDTSMKSVNRQNEQVLGNMSAYSIDQVREAANASAGFLGNTPEAQKLANTAVAQKLVQDKIPAVVRNAKTGEEKEGAVDEIRQLLKSQGLEGAGVEEMLGQLRNKIDQGASESDIQEFVGKAFEGIGKGAETLLNITKKYNDTLQQARKYQADYNKALLEAGSYLRKANQVRLNAELDLAKALGRSPTLEELNKPFDAEVSSLTSGLVQSGKLSADNASDPMAIANAITAAEKQKAAIEKSSPELFKAGAGIPEGAAGDPMREKLNQEQLANIQAVGQLTVASNEGRQALEKLANDGTKAANALSKIQEQQQAMEGFGNFAQKVFTAEPEELAKMEINAAAANAAQTAGPEFFKSRRNRQQAYAGLEQKREFMLPEEYRKEKATLTRKNFEAQGYKGGDVVTTIGGKGITLDELTKRLEGGVDETDPNVIEFRKATEIQAQANEALGKLNVEQAIIIQDAMKSLEFFLRDEFPNILSKANADSQTDAQTKPQTKPQEKPQASQETQDALKQAKATQQARKDAETKAKDAYKAESGIGPAGGMAKKAAQNKAAEATAARKAADANVASLEAKANAELEESAKQQKAQEEERKASEEAAKVKQKEADKAKSQEVINRNKTTRDGARPRMVGENETPSERKQRVEETYGRLKQQQNTVAPIQAPPPPGATAQTQKSKEQLYNERASKEGFGSYETITKRQEEINKEIEKKQKIVAGKKKMLQAAKFAAMQATDENGKAKYEGKEGYKESPAYKKAEEALAQAEAGLASSQNDYKTNEGTIARFTAPTPTTVSVASNPKPEVGIQSRNTNMQQPAGMFGNIPYSGDTRTPQDPDNLRLPNNSSAPIPVTKPERTSEQTTPYNSEDKKLVNAQMITIDPESITALNTFNANFSKYVTDLINFEFPKIPEKIDVVLSNTEHTVEVRFTGSAALEKLNGDLQKTALALVQPELAKLRDEIAAAMGPSGGVKNSAAMGQRTPNSGK